MRTPGLGGLGSLTAVATLLFIVNNLRDLTLSISTDDKRRLKRRKDHIAKDLRTPKYRPRVIESKKHKPSRYPTIEDVFLSHEYNPTDKDTE